MPTQDFNNDAILNIVVVNYGTKNIGLLLGRSDRSFKQQKTFSLDFNSNPHAIVVADYNNDKHLDLAVVNDGTNNVDMLLGSSIGGFKRHGTYGYGLSDGPFIAVPGDFNRDGQPELFLAYENSDHIDVLIIYDTGTLKNPIFTSATGRYKLFTVGDCNNDAVLDIIVVACGGTAVFEYGNGSFTNPTIYQTDSWLSSVIVANLNNDTFLDIIVADSDKNNIGILFGYVKGSFGSQTTCSVFSAIKILPANDLNNDSCLDFVVHEDYSTINILLGNCDDSLANQLLLIDVTDVTEVTVGDFNNDGRLDIVFSSYFQYQVKVFLGYGNGSFANQRIFSVGCNLEYVTGGDLNNDTQLEIVVTNSASSTINVLLGYGNGSFETRIMYPTIGSPNYVAIADFSNDSQMDILVTSPLSNAFDLFLGDFDKVFASQRTVITGHGSRPRSFVIGDFNNDTHMDISVVNSGTNNLGIFLGTGNASFASQMLYSNGDSPWSITAAHFNNDTHLDIVVVNANDSTIGVFLGYGNGSFPNQITCSTGFKARPSPVPVADFDNDDFLDIVVADLNSNKKGDFCGCHL